MGAQEFCDSTRRSEQTETAKEAFATLVDQDRYENGHSYSGGIGMKDGYNMAGTVATAKEAQALVTEHMESDDSPFMDKWGPAGCIEITEGDISFVFFGLASS